MSEFMLRIMAWLSTRDDSCSHSQMCIVAGPNIDMAIKLIKRVKNIFETKLGLTFQNKENVLELNGCTIAIHSIGVDIGRLFRHRYGCTGVHEGRGRDKDRLLAGLAPWRSPGHC